MLKVGVLCIVRGLTLDVQYNGTLVTVVGPLLWAHNTRAPHDFAWAYPCAMRDGRVMAFRPSNLLPISDPDSVADDRGDIPVGCERYVMEDR